MLIKVCVYVISKQQTVDSERLRKILWDGENQVTLSESPIWTTNSGSVKENGRILGKDKKDEVDDRASRHF